MKLDLSPILATITALSFRWVKPAASLKRRIADWRRTATRKGFPLGKTGGLIEAPLHSSQWWMVPQWFPLGKTGGLIEAAIYGPVLYVG